MNRSRIPAALVALVIGALLALPRLSYGADKPAVYTAEQATAGASAFSASCAGCHGQNLEGVAAPPLAGAAFLRNWNGKTADDLFYIMSHDMPADNPGSLTKDQYLSILAFVLQKNGYPAGSAPLDPTKLKAIAISQ